MALDTPLTINARYRKMASAPEAEPPTPDEVIITACRLAARRSSSGTRTATT